MCGRLNVIDEPLCKVISERLGLNFKTTSNVDLRPTQTVSTVASQHGELIQVDLPWGIKPDWAKRIIINAQAETVSIKPTFSAAFEFHRVVVPCTGWYEWREEQSQKIKYLFSLGESKVLFMAGIAVDNGSKLVTLTTAPNKQCGKFHHRMPLVIPDDSIITWLNGNGSALHALLVNEFDEVLTIDRCS